MNLGLSYKNNPVHTFEFSIVVIIECAYCVAYHFHTMKIFLIFCFGVFATGLVQNDQLYKDLSNFCSNNGMVFVSLTLINEQPLLQNKAHKAYETFQKYGLRVRRLSYEKL